MSKFARQKEGSLTVMETNYSSATVQVSLVIQEKQRDGKTERGVKRQTED